VVSNTFEQYQQTGIPLQGGNKEMFCHISKFSTWIQVPKIAKISKTIFVGGFMCLTV